MSVRVLFVNHTSAIAGGEHVLLDVAQAWSGAAAYLFEDGPLVAALRARGLDAQVSRFGQGLSAIRRDSDLRHALPLAGRMAGVIAGIARAARRHDVIYANSQKAFVLASAAAVIARRPLIWHLHDVITEAHFGAGQRRLQVTLANRCAAAVLVPSEVAADAFIGAGGHADLVHVLPNGIDLAPDLRPAAEIRRALGLPDGPLIGVFSRLAAWKGQHVALDALARVPDAHGIVAGAALFGEHAYERSLHALARSLGIDHRVHFLGQRDDVPVLMRACDAMVHPSVDPEPFGRTLIEAMLMRLPVIASDTGAPVDILDNGACGTLVPPGDAEALAAAIRAALAPDPSRTARLDRAETRAKTHYGVVAMRAAAVDLIGRVAAEAREGAVYAWRPARPG